MVTAVQLLLAIVICVLTFLITFAAIQTFYLLHDLRQAAKKINQLLDKPNPEFALRQILQVAPKYAEEPVKDDRVLPHFPEEAPPQTPVSRLPRFFRKSGSPLRS